MRWTVPWVLCALLASGCSTVKLLYGQADILLEDWVDKHIDLNARQERLVDRRIDEYMAWHRTAMLPRYAGFMRGIARDYHTRGNFDRARFDVVAAEARVLMEDTMRGGFPFIAEMLVDLSPEQIDSFDAKLEERTKESIARWSKPKPERIKEGIGNTISILEMFVGDLTEEQKRRLERDALPLYRREPLWIENRRRRNMAVVGLLRNEPSRADLEQFVEPWLLRPWEFSSLEYKAYSDGFRRDIEGLIFGVLSTLNEKQRQTFVGTLNDYADDLSELAS